MGKSFDKIEDIFEDSAKAEFMEKLGKILDTEGCKMVVITGVPSKVRKGLEVEVWQTGSTYRYEELGFIQEGYNIVEFNGEEDKEQR